MSKSKPKTSVYTNIGANFDKKKDIERTIHHKTEKSSFWTAEYLDKEEADVLLTLFSSDEFPLESDPKIKIFGKEATSHRRVGFFSDDATGYPFAGQVAKALPLKDHPMLVDLLKRVNQDLDTDFNGILINHYRNGTDYIGKHSDDESTLSRGVVAGISLGASRKFRIRDKAHDDAMVIDVPTAHGQLLVMDGAFQREFKHEIPIQKKVLGGRVSLTFRKHIIH